MRAPLLAALLALALPACVPVVAPSTVAQATVLDEKAAIAVETAYTTASRLGNTLSRAGLIDRNAFQAADNRAYAAVLAARAAYRAGNASGYAQAIVDANAALLAIKGLVK